MTLEEAIRHAEEKAKCGGRCGEEHAQLAMWLKELQAWRTTLTCADCRHAGNRIADGRYWCKYHEDYMRYCSDAERRQ